MVKHIVLWKLTEEAKKNEDKLLEELCPRFAALVGVVDGLLTIELGKNYNGGNYDIALNCEFTTKEAQAGYQKHPAHLAIKPMVHDNICDRTCVDYEL